MIIKYDKNNNPVRVAEVKVEMNAKWRKEMEIEFTKKYGAWWVFTGVPQRHKRKKHWIEQFRKKGV